MKIKFLMLVGGLLIFVSGCNPQNSEIDFNFCREDSDCISVQDGCCDCNNGGKATAINKNYVNEWNNKIENECKNFFCISVISDDPSCFMQPKCINNKCELV